MVHSETLLVRGPLPLEKPDHLPKLLLAILCMEQPQHLLLLFDLAFFRLLIQQFGYFSCQLCLVVCVVESFVRLAHNGADRGLQKEFVHRESDIWQGKKRPEEDAAVEVA